MKHYYLKQAALTGLLLTLTCILPASLFAGDMDTWNGTAIAEKIENVGGNDGKSFDKPILIATAAELAYLAQQTNAGGTTLELGNGTSITGNASGFAKLYFKLIADLDLAGHEWIPIGNQKTFTASFDGGGHMVKGLKVDLTGMETNTIYAGLFGYVDSGSNNFIQNLHVILAEGGITATGTNKVYAGGIAGYVVSIRNCCVTGSGSITAKSSGGDVYVGGIAGFGNPKNCYATIPVCGAMLANVSNSVYAGGVAGKGGTTAFCFATGKVVGNAEGFTNPNVYVAGIMANASTVSNCLALNNAKDGTADIEFKQSRTNSKYRKRVADSSGSVTITNCYARNMLLFPGTQQDYDYFPESAKDEKTATGKNGADCDLLTPPNITWGEAWNASDANNLPVLKMVTEVNADGSPNAYGVNMLAEQPALSKKEYLPGVLDVGVYLNKSVPTELKYEDGCWKYTNEGKTTSFDGRITGYNNYITPFTVTATTGNPTLTLTNIKKGGLDSGSSDPFLTIKPEVEMKVELKGKNTFVINKGESVIKNDGKLTLKLANPEADKFDFFSGSTKGVITGTGTLTAENFNLLGWQIPVASQSYSRILAWTSTTNSNITGTYTTPIGGSFSYATAVSADSYTLQMTENGKIYYYLQGIPFGTNEEPTSVFTAKPNTYTSYSLELSRLISADDSNASIDRVGSATSFYTGQKVSFCIYKNNNRTLRPKAGFPKAYKNGDKSVEVPLVADKVTTGNPDYTFFYYSCIMPAFPVSVEMEWESNDNTALKTLSYQIGNGQTVAINSFKGEDECTVLLPSGSTGNVSLAGVPETGTVSATTQADLPASSTATLTVKALDGTEKTYTVNFVVADADKHIVTTQEGIEGGRVLMVNAATGKMVASGTTIGVNTQISLSAITLPGYDFEKFTVAKGSGSPSDVMSNPSSAITVDGDLLISASFKKKDNTGFPAEAAQEVSDVKPAEVTTPTVVIDSPDKLPGSSQLSEIRLVKSDVDESLNMVIEEAIAEQALDLDGKEVVELSLIKLVTSITNATVSTPAKSDTTVFPVQPQGKVTLCIPYPAGTDKMSHTFSILHIRSDGSPLVYTSEKDGGLTLGDTYMEIEVSGFSPFVIGFKKVQATPPPTPPYVPTYYNVTIPAIEGAVTTPKAGSYVIEEGYNFVFSLVLDAAYSESVPVVKVGGMLIAPRESDGKYILRNIQATTDVTIEGIRMNTSVANEAITPGGLRVWAADGTLNIHTAQIARAYIVTFDGRLARIVDLTSGDNRFSLPAGAYIVKIGKEAFKVSL